MGSWRAVWEHSRKDEEGPASEEMNNHQAVLIYLTSGIISLTLDLILWSAFKWVFKNFSLTNSMHGVTLSRKIKGRNYPLQVLSLNLLFPKSKCQPQGHRQEFCWFLCNWGNLQPVWYCQIVPILLHSSANTEGLVFIGSFMVPGKVHSWPQHHISPPSKLVKTIDTAFYYFAFLQTSFNPGSAPPS